MNKSFESKAQLVGPILWTGSKLTPAILEALNESNRDCTVTDRGSYVRAMAPTTCVLRAADVERITGMSFQLPGDLESIMSSFKGKLSFRDGEAIWTTPPGGAK